MFLDIDIYKDPRRGKHGKSKEMAVTTLTTDGDLK